MIGDHFAFRFVVAWIAIVLLGTALTALLIAVVL